MNWVIFTGIGILISIILAIKEGKTEPVRSYAKQAIVHLCTIGGLTFLVTGFIFPLMKLYAVGVIPVLVSVIAGIILFTFGGIIEWNYLKWCGILWLLGSIFMAVLHWHYRSLILIPLILVGYLIPGFILYSRYRKDSKE